MVRHDVLVPDAKVSTLIELFQKHRAIDSGMAT